METSKAGKMIPPIRLLPACELMPAPIRDALDFAVFSEARASFVHIPAQSVEPAKFMRKEIFPAQ